MPEVSRATPLDGWPVERTATEAEEVRMATRTLTLRRDDRCDTCHGEVRAGTRATWDARTRTVRCVGCTERPAAKPHRAEPLDRGTAGASAAREYDRRKAAREQRVRSRHPRLGGVILALTDEPQHQRAWERGRRGEQAVAESLERRTADGPTVLLHDRRMPQGRGNVDHLAVAPTGVYVIDAKDVSGKVAVRTPLLGRPQLLVAGRDRTQLIDGLDRQVAVVTAALGEEDAPPVHGVLCFTRAELPLLGTPRMRGHLLVHRKALAKRLNAAGPLDAARIDALARRLAAALPAA